ncbi:transmembrane channel-like protein [Macrosteles quadrilineatus]|uniref:transmembrane channel-like protein n=1 Tax=Macrosteles quadrilineatus TaxID=74068 RepID=UPI0023E2E6E0|nr:transmembrane channel-like protein [Macrosteles quadrilineatus]
MDKVRFESEKAPSDAEEDEDYSQSVSAIFQRKASTRHSRKRRRSSSPKFVTDVEDGQNSGKVRNRRRSSVFTTSSGEVNCSTAISVEDAVQEQILQNIKLHKEVLSSVKQQPWNMRRKLRLVRQAKAYIRRHEGELQERLAQSRSTRDILARFNIVIIRHWQHTKRELANLLNTLIPWEIRIKEIESHFGSVVASYFTFLRWLFWVNLVTAVILIVFVAVPELVMSNPEKSGMRKKMLEQEKANATNLFTLWDFDGVLKYSPLFYGYYSHRDPEPYSLAKKINYSMPLAYFITELVVYIYSFVAILRRMAENSRQSKLSEKDDECVFTWKLFTGWDYMIGNSETAHNRTASIILGFKEALLEEAEKKRDEGRNWKVTSLRVFAHMNVCWLLGSSVYAVILVVQRSTELELEHNHGWWRKNEITIVVSLITSLFPVFFEVFGIIEQYHPRKKLRMQLARIMALNLLNIYTLIFASFSKINAMSDLLEKMRGNVTRQVPEAHFHEDEDQFKDYLTGVSPFWDHNLTGSQEWYEDCRNITIPCSMTSTVGVQLMFGLSLFTSNLSTFTTKSLEDSSSSSPSFSTDFFTSSPMFDRSNTSEKFLSFSESKDLEVNNVTSGEFDGNFTLPEYIDVGLSEIYADYKNSLDGNTSEFENYIDPRNGTTFNFSEISNDTYFETTTDISNFSTFKNSESTERDTLTTPQGRDETPSTMETTSEFSTSSTGSASTNIEELCVVVKCETVAKPSEKTTTPTQTTSQSMMTTHTAATIGYLDSGDPNQRWSKRRPYPKKEDMTPYIKSLDEESKKKLVPLCWETMFGREMVKLTVMDLVMTVISTLMVDFFRAVFVRFMNNCWCWDLEKKFPQYGDFKIAENILHLVNNQGMVWMGMFFSPGLPLINVIKLAIMMYLRSWAVLTCNVPHEVVFRASRSNNFYLALLLTMLFLCVLPVGYAVVWVVPSWHCGPFSRYHRIYHIFTSSLKQGLPYDWLHKAFDYIASPSIVIPLLMLLVLIIYYLISLTSALREANNDLKIQLRRERTEERRKMFQLVDKKRQEAENPSLKWKKAMPNFPYGKLSIADIPIDLLKVGAINGNANYESTKKDLIEEFMKKAKRMPSGTSEEENILLDAGDGTDAEQHDSLPYDVAKDPKYAGLIKKKDGTDKKILKYEETKRRNGKKKIEKEKHSSSKEDGSENSVWSEIPEIRIIQTESNERLDIDSQSDEVKPSKIKDKSRSSSSQQKVKKKNEKKVKSGQSTRNETGEKRSDSAKSSPRHTKKINKQKKRSSSKTEGESSIDAADSGNEISEETSPTESNRKNFDNKTTEKPKVHKLKAIITASQAMKKREKSQTKQNQDESEGRTGKDHKRRTVKNKEESSHKKSSKSKLKNESDEDAVLKSSKESGDDSQDEGEESENSENSDVSDDESEHKSESDEELTHSESDTKTDSESKTSSKHLKKQSNSTETEGSDVSSHTVKQLEVLKQKQVSKSEMEDENDGERSKTQTSKENKSSKKAMARFKIANVLLKEARRRSSSGLEEK